MKRNPPARRPRYTRRYVLGATAATGAYAGALLAGCSTANRSSSSATSAPSKSASAGTPRTGGTLNAYITVSPPTLDAQATKSIPGRSASGNVMSRLFRHKTSADPAEAYTGDLENELATSAESPDALTWTVKLRPDAKFQNVPPVNGHAVEAEDIKATFTRALTLTASAAKSYLGMVDVSQIQTPDKNTVVFKLKYAYSPFKQTLSNAVGAYIYPREVQGGYDPAKVVIGSGPFLLDSYTPDVALTYRKNPSWFEQGRPYVDAQKVPIIPNPAQQLAQFTAGNIDFLTVGQNDLDAAKRASPKATVLNAPLGNPYQIYSHMDDPASPFRDVRVRQAISMAIDRASIGKALFSNNFQNNGVIAAAKGKWALPPDQLGNASQYYSYNLDAAKKLVAESGAGDQFKKLVWPHNFPSPEVDTYAQIINPMLNAAGIKTVLAPVDYATQWVPPDKGVLYGHYGNDTLVMIQWQSVTNTADAELFDALTPGGSSNHSAVTDPTVTDMIHKMLTLTDDTERLKAVQDIQRYVADKMYYITMPYGYTYTLVQPRINNFNYSLGVDTAGAETYSKLWIAG